MLKWGWVIAAALTLAGCAETIKSSLTKDAYPVSHVEVVYFSRLPMPMLGRLTIRGSYTTPTIDDATAQAMQDRLSAGEADFYGQVRQNLQANTGGDVVPVKVSTVKTPNLLKKSLPVAVAAYKFTSDDALVVFPESSNVSCVPGFFSGPNCSVTIKFLSVLFDTKAKRVMWQAEHFIPVSYGATRNENAYRDYWKIIVETLRKDGLTNSSGK